MGGSGLLITELATSGTKFVEIQNVSRQTINTAGWTVLANDPTGGVNGVSAAAWSLPASIAANGVSYSDFGGALNWDLTGSGWAMILDAGGHVQDFVAWGYSDAEIAGLNISFGGFTNITVGSQWSGAGAAAGSSTAGGTFVAFNDQMTGPRTSANATTFSTNTTASGRLKDIATGLQTNVILTTSQTAAVIDTNSVRPAAGTDAYNVFDPYVDFSNVAGSSIEIAAGDNAQYTHTFSGLDTGPTATYEFTGTSIRGSGTYNDRWTLVTLVGADSATAAHSVNATAIVVVSPTQVAIMAGQNHLATQGVVAHWTNIDPGPDGEFSIVSTHYTGAVPGGIVNDGTKTYALTAVRLAGETPPRAMSVLKRTVSSDGNAAGDFVRSDVATMGVGNGELTVPFGQEVPNLTGVGFSDNQPAFDAVIQTDVAQAMQGVNASLWTRIDFDAPRSVLYDTLKLRMKYDDGFVAYLNGTEVARRNADNPLAYDMAASAQHDNAAAVVYEEIDISQFAGLLQETGNVLAIRGLNIAAGDADFLVDAQLFASGGSTRRRPAPLSGRQQGLGAGVRRQVRRRQGDRSRFRRRLVRSADRPGRAPSRHDRPRQLPARHAHAGAGRNARRIRQRRPLLVGQHGDARPAVSRACSFRPIRSNSTTVWAARWSRRPAPAASR